MNYRFGFCIVLLFYTRTLNVYAQNPVTFFMENSSENPCITTVQYAAIEARCDKNSQKFIINNPENRPAAVLLQWPLQAASNIHDCSYYYISAHVDHDNTTAFKDYNCGTITYNGHKGTDIAIGPFPMEKMDNNQVQVIAAAAGIIIDKHDGEYDKNCVGVGSNLPANYVIIQHADGSRALYWHMKSGKVTTKTIGQSVVAGEYLGIVGSSGSSSGPHLHFEIWAGSTSATVIDPFSGSCNVLNASSWWAEQKNYIEPAVLKASVHTTDIIFNSCQTADTVCESNTYVIPFQGKGLAAGYAKFYIFLRNITSGTNANMSILNPDGSVFTSWTSTNFSGNNNFWYLQYSKKLPTISGTYSFLATYNGITCSQQFDIRTCADNYSAWYGTTDSNWSNAANWSCGTVPDNNTNVIIYSGVPNIPVVSSAAFCRSIKIYPTANIKINTGFKLNVSH